MLGEPRCRLHQRSGEDIMSSTDRVWELMKKIGICMLASWDGQELQARPMGAYVRPDEHACSFLPTRATTKMKI